MKSNKRNRRITRHRRIEAKMKGSAKCPRLCIFRSNQHIYAQLIDDEKHKTVLSASDRELKSKAPKTKIAAEVGKLIAKKAKNLPAGRQVEKIIFDRAGYKYHGRVKLLADGAREGGLKF